MSRRVVGPAAVIPDGEGKLRYFYRGSYLPEGLDGDAVQRCIRRGLVAEVEDPAPVEVPDEDPEDSSEDDDELDDGDHAEDDELDDGDHAEDQTGDGNLEGDDLAVVVTSDGVEHTGVLPASAAATPERPKLTASTKAWADFRRPTHGDAVDGMSRQQLIDLG